MVLKPYEKIPDEFTNLVAERIGSAMYQQDMPPKELANKAKVSYNAVISWQNGVRTPSAYTLAKIARVLGVTTDYLLGLTEVSGAAS